MIFPVIFAVSVWALAMKFRRRWPSFTIVGAAILVLLGLFRLSQAWDTHLPSAYRHIFVLFWPYTILVGLMGLYIACLPRPATGWQCRRCRYDLSGLDPRGLDCPECGEAWRGPGSGREDPEPTMIPIPRGPTKRRNVL